MKGIKLGIVGICLSLLGIAFSTNHVIAISGAALGLTVALAGCFIKDN